MIEALTTAWTNALAQVNARHYGSPWPGMIRVCEAATHAPWPMTLADMVRVAGRDPFTRWDPADRSLTVVRWTGWPPRPDRCTGIAATWCQTCGDCTCPRDELGQIDFAAGEHTCPLHSLDSEHAQKLVEA